MTCCIPWIVCQLCGEDVPLYMIEEYQDKQVCSECRKKIEEKDQKA